MNGPWSSIWKLMIIQRLKQCYQKRSWRGYKKATQKILRCIKFQLPTGPPTPLLLLLNIVKLEDIFNLNVLTFVYKAINKYRQSSFITISPPDSSVHSFGTRQATRGDLFISFKRTTLYGLKTVKYIDSKLWNTLPLFIRVTGCHCFSL